MEKKTINSRADIETLVNSFYERVQKDNLIGPIFNELAKINWDKHLPKMYDFWGDLLLGDENYHGRPFPPHIPLQLERQHFERWIALFLETVDEHFVGLLAEEAKRRALKIAIKFQLNLGLIQPT